MRIRISLSSILVLLLLTLASCADRSDNRDNESNGYSFYELDSQMLKMPSPFAMFFDYNTNAVYINGSDGDGMGNGGSLPNVKVTALNAENLSSNALDFSRVVDDGFFMISLYPSSDGGYWFLEVDTTGEIPRLKHCSADLVVEFDFELYTIVDRILETAGVNDDVSLSGGVITQDGLVMARNDESVYMLDIIDEKVLYSWDISGISDPSRTSLDRIATSGDDIYYFRSDRVSAEIYRLSPGQERELVFKDNKQYSEFFAGPNGQIYLFDSEDCNLYSLAENDDLELVFNTTGLQTSANLDNLIVLPNDEYIALIGGGYYLISKNGRPELERDPNKEIITLACYGMNGYEYIRQKALDFSRENEEYEIEVVDYSQYGEDGITKLKVDIISGNGPDMFWWGSSMDVAFNSSVYGAAGQLMDLHTLLSEDEDISEATFLPNLLAALESESGELYELPLGFALHVVAADAEVVGSEQGITPDEFFALLERHPEVDYPFGTGNWKTILNFVLVNNFDTFVDWEKAECYFDSEGFTRILEIVKMNSAYDGQSILPPKLVKDGRQLFYSNMISTASSVQKFSALFGEDVNFIGFPTTHGVGNSFSLSQSVSISAASEFPEVCWEFLKQFLAREEQLKDVFFYPANYETLTEQINNSANDGTVGLTIRHNDSDGDIWAVTLEEASQENIDAVWKIIESCDRVYRGDPNIMAIIESEAPAYFDGQKTLDEVCEVIQNRAQTYVSEQS